MDATIKDVAKMADVSISTVSRVINDSKPVSPEARRRVLHAIEVLDYKPNEIARSLVTKKSNLVGVIINDLGTFFSSQVLRGVEEIGRMYNYDILVASSYDNPELEINFAKLFLRKQVEGVIVISETLNQKLMYKLEELKIPHLNINRYYNIDQAGATINYQKATKDMIDYIIEKGHKKIAFVGIGKDIDRTVEKYKVQGYKDAVQEKGLESEIIYTQGTKPQDVKEIIEYVDQVVKNKGITAIFCAQDEIAIHLMNEFFDKGIEVPKDISVAGFGNSNLGMIYRPRLTTVKEPYYDMGAVSIRSLLKTIESKEEMEKDIVLPTQILERESVKEVK